MEDEVAEIKLAMWWYLIHSIYGVTAHLENWVSALKMNLGTEIHPGKVVKLVELWCLAEWSTDFKTTAGFSACSPSILW